MKAFVYIWLDTKNKCKDGKNMKYIGKHLGTPDDGYTHSSSLMESFTMKNKPPYMKRRILFEGKHEEVSKLENTLTNRVAHRADYYNQYTHPHSMELSAKGGRNNKGISKKVEHKKKISISLTGLVKSESTKKKTSKSMQGNTNSKNHNSKEYREKQSQAMREVWKRRKAKVQEKTFDIDKFISPS